jgi:tetratricopeptide (TPR) repeat protein
MAYNAIYYCYQGLKDQQKALDCLLHALSLDTDDFETNFNLGCYYMNSDVSKSIEHFERANDAGYMADEN